MTARVYTQHVRSGGDGVGMRSLTMSILKQDAGTTVVTKTTEQFPWEVVGNYLAELEQAGHRFGRVTALTRPMQVHCQGCRRQIRWYAHPRMDQVQEYKVHSDIGIGEQCAGALLNLHGD